MPPWVPTANMSMMGPQVDRWLMPSQSSMEDHGTQSGTVHLGSRSQVISRIKETRYSREAHATDCHEFLKSERSALPVHYPQPDTISTAVAREGLAPERTNELGLPVLYQRPGSASSSGPTVARLWNRAGSRCRLHASGRAQPRYRIQGSPRRLIPPRGLSRKRCADGSLTPPTATRPSRRRGPRCRLHASIRAQPRCRTQFSPRRLIPPAGLKGKWLSSRLVSGDSTQRMRLPTQTMTRCLPCIVLERPRLSWAGGPQTMLRAPMTLMTRCLLCIVLESPRLS